MSVTYLDLEDILGFYADLFQCTTQEAADQLRSREGLAAALARPRWHATYSGADLASQAAVLAHGIAEGQPFIEGNKRVTLVSLVTFLALNGYALSVSQSERARWLLQFAAGATVEQIADEIRNGLVILPPEEPRRDE